MEIGERAGSGMDKIFDGWKWAGYVNDLSALVLGAFSLEFIEDERGAFRPHEGTRVGESFVGERSCENAERLVERYAVFLGDKLKNVGEFLVDVKCNVDALVSVFAIQGDTFSSTQDVRLRGRYGMTPDR